MNLLRRVSGSLREEEPMTEDELHDSIRRELVRKIFVWSNRVIIGMGSTGAVLLFASGSDQYVFPMTAALVASFTGVLPWFGYSHKSLMSLTLACVSLLIFYTAIASQDCSAFSRLVFYSCMPGIVGLLYRTKSAILLSIVGVLSLIFVIFAVDLSGHCRADFYTQNQVETIIAERLIPLVGSIVMNGVLVSQILEHSQEALTRHVEAAQASKKLAAKHQAILRRLAHELRTPLNGMTGSMELLTSSDDMTDYDMENARTTDSCLKNMIRICDNILTAAKSEFMAGTQKETAFCLTSCVDFVTDSFAAKASTKGIRLMLEFAGNTTSLVRGMNVELCQVLMNLVGNAIKFTPSGSVTIRVREELPSSSPEFLKYMFEVQDTGIGVKNPEMVFEAFYQEEQDTVSRQHEGTGLGLTICLSLVQEMGGKITIESQPGQGSRFLFNLTLRREPGTSPSPSSNDTERLPILSDDAEVVPRVMIADSDKTSATCCESLIKSLAPSAVLSSVQTHSSLMDLVAKEDSRSSSDSGSYPRIIFMGCDELATDTLVSTLRKLKSDGWSVFAYSDYDSFSHLSKNGSKHATKVFRKPLPLVAAEDALRKVLVSGSLPPPFTTDEGSGEQVTIDTPRVEKDDRPASSQMEEESANRSPTSAGPTNTPPSLAPSSSSRHHPSPSRSLPTETSPMEARESPSDSLTNAGPRNTSSSTALLPSAPPRNASPPTTSSTDASSPSAARPSISRRSEARRDTIELPPGSKVIVVDDTPMNVKVLMKLLSRTLSSSVPILSYAGGQDAIDAVASSRADEHLLILMDWHMPGLCGLSTTLSIRQLLRKRGKNGPHVRICMVSADKESIYQEMDNRGITWSGEILDGELKLRDGIIGTSEGEDVGRLISEPSEEELDGARQFVNSESTTTVDFLAMKPVGLKNVKAVLTWFSTVT